MELYFFLAGYRLLTTGYLGLYGLNDFNESGEAG
jgi:hypothetical protein